MASFVSALPAVDSSIFSHSPYASASQAAPAPVPQLTTGEQMRLLEQQGHSTSQIAEALGVPLTQVQSELGLTTSAATVPTPALSIKA